jgi:2-polyprenyl-6-methoxyphenol hydroxylase-like FAD-dependent oxidoreductase
MTDITIVGGGIAGLALAAALDPGRFDVTVHEQREGLPDAGTSLAMWPEARSALDEIGALEELAGMPGIDRFPILTTSGRRLLELPVPPGLLVSRGDLLRALDAAVPATVRRVSGRVDGTPGAGRGLLVGADGVHSVVRSVVDESRADARLTPYLAVRGVVPVTLPVEHHGEHWGRGLLFGASPHRSGTNWYASFRSDLGPRHVDVAEALHAARRQLAGAEAPAVGPVLDAADEATTLAQRIWTVGPLRTYARARAVLVGDAAHAMTPNLGRGACESLVDAVTLARLLGELPVDRALAAYDAVRRRPTQRLQRRAEVAMRVALATGMQPARDGLAALVGRAVPAARPRTAVPAMRRVPSAAPAGPE